MYSNKELFAPRCTSLALEMSLLLNSYFFPVYLSFMIGSFIWKTYVLPYDFSLLISEIILFSIGSITKIFFLFFGSLGNKTEGASMLVIFLFLSPPLIGYLFYLVIFQTYILYLDIIVVSMEIIFSLFQIIFGFIVLILVLKEKIKGE